MSGSTKSQSSAVPEIPQHYRISVPIDKDMLTQDWIQTNELIKSLKSHDVFVDDVELQHRETVVKRLNSLFKEWLQDMCIEMNVPEIFIDNVGYRLLPFGSYGLGAFSKGADIDALCVGPVFLERTVFFTSFFEKIKAQEEAKDIRAIEEAFVPVINLTFDGIEVDLVYAQMPQYSLTLNLLDDMWLKDMDKASARSLNGYRVTEEILRLVPNVSNFRLALMAIKLWAKRRNIYSSKLGFLGGVSWAILVARICQVYPNVTASTLVMKFFRVYSMWEWPIPIRLRVVQDLHYNLPFWDSMYNIRDQYHLMPIITPAYPQQNSAFNVSLSSLTILVEEFNRGQTIVQEIQQHKADWFKLFETPNFMDKYRDYLQVEATSATEEQHLDWVGLVESRIRHLVGALQIHQSITLAHVNVQPYSPPKEADSTEGLSTKWSIGFTLTEEFEKMRNKNDRIDLTCEVRYFTDTVYNMASTSGVFQKGMVVSVNYEEKCANVLPHHTADKDFSVTSRPSKVPPASTAQQATKRSRSPSPGTSTERSSQKFRTEEKGVKEAKTTSPGKSPAGVSPSETQSKIVSPPSEDGAGTPDLESPAKTSNINLTLPPDELSDLPSEIFHGRENLIV
ncbi:poly(A) polymerase type 3-like [Limanda limanda]|uniref:poly(A) polymerase type 3-like n=1 Tax=Limanda limanda TaxID=27771 RepID=UPI0029C8B9D9|nr:poly(A) polymerase type 3-like [Limanda limanda]